MFSQTLSFSLCRLWSRRTGILQTSNRFARQLLLLTAEKLELGERDTRTVPKRLPPVNGNEENKPLAIERSAGQTTPQESNLMQSARAQESNRLQGARALLDSLQKDSVSEIANAALPVSNQPSR